MIRIRYWFLVAGTAIKNWATDPISNVHLCWFFAALHVVFAVVTKDWSILNPIPVWLLASFYALRIVEKTRECDQMRAVNKLQRTLLSMFFNPRTARAESKDGDLGSSSSTTGEVSST